MDVSRGVTQQFRMLVFILLLVAMSSCSDRVTEPEAIQTMLHEIPGCITSRRGESLMNRLLLRIHLHRRSRHHMVPPGKLLSGFTTIRAFFGCNRYDHCDRRGYSPQSV